MAVVSAFGHRREGVVGVAAHQRVDDAAHRRGVAVAGPQRCDAAAKVADQFVQFGKTAPAGFMAFAELLQRHAALQGDLLAVTHGLLIRRMLDDLYWVMSYSRWADERYWPLLKAAILETHPQVTETAMDAARDYNAKRYYYQGIGRYTAEQVYARGRDLVVLSMVNPGAEVIADGHIHVYAPLRGRAIAGARGNTAARILCTCLEPQLVSVAGIYRTAENPLPDNLAGKPAQVRLEGERLIIEPLGA